VQSFFWYFQYQECAEFLLVLSVSRVCRVSSGTSSIKIFKYVKVITPNFVFVSKMATFNLLLKIIYYDWPLRALTYVYYTYFSKD
jgi:hypothetical protein